MPQKRLDKYLSEMGIGTRSEVKSLIKKGSIKVNGEIVKLPEYKVDTDTDSVVYNDKTISYVDFEYFMLNKPSNVLSAARDKKATTVVDLIKTKIRDDLFPLGRLDKDTEGLLIITNDGDMTHKLLSPRYHVPKKYYAKVDGVITEDHISMFNQGITLSDGTKLLPAKLKILSSDEKFSEIELVIYEGKFHQVKRMISYCGGEVTYLKRLSMGDIKLDDNLKPGEYRRLTKEEISILKGAYNNAK